MECHSQMPGLHVRCHVNAADAYTFEKNVLVCCFKMDNKDLCFIAIQLQHVGFHPLTDTGDAEFYFPDGNLG